MRGAMYNFVSRYIYQNQTKFWVFFQFLLCTDIPIAIRMCFLTNSKYSYRTEYTYMRTCISCEHLYAGWGQVVAFLQLLPKNLLVSSKPAIIVQASNVEPFRDCRAEDQWSRRSLQPCFKEDCKLWEVAKHIRIMWNLPIPGGKVTQKLSWGKERKTCSTTEEERHS